MQVIKNNNSKLISIFISVFGYSLFLLGAMNNYGMNNAACIYVLFLSFYFIWISKNNYLFAILFIILFYCNYSVAFSQYIVVNKSTMYTQLSNSDASKTGIYILLLFWSTLALFSSRKLPAFSTEDKNDFWSFGLKDNRSFVISISIDVVLIIILIYGFTRPDHFGERGSPSSYYEYSIILFILNYFFCTNKALNIITTGILFLYAGQNFLYGGRIMGLQLLILYYCMRLEKRIPLKRIVPYAVLGFVLFSIIGTNRGDWLISDYSLSKIMDDLSNNLFTLDTAYSAYHTSLTIILSETKSTFDIRFSMLFSFIKSVFWGGYGTIDNDVTRYSYTYYYHQNGGFLPFFFHFYLGWFGVVLIGIVVGLIYKACSIQVHKLTGFKKCLLIYFVTTSFRWYIYSPIHLFRGVLILTLAYFVIYYLVLWTNHTNIQSDNNYDCSE